MRCRDNAIDSERKMAACSRAKACASEYSSYYVHLRTTMRVAVSEERLFASKT